MFEDLLELLKKVVPGSESNSGAINGILPEGFNPSLGRSFSHVRESRGDFLHVIAVGSLVYCKVELDGVHPEDSHFIGAIEGLGFAELEFSRFDDGR